MKKNLLFAGLVYCFSTIVLMIYLTIVASYNEELVGMFFVSCSLFVSGVSGFVAYLIYFLKQKKIAEESAYLNYLSMGIRVQLGMLISVITGVLLTLALIYCRSNDYIAHIWEIIIPVSVFTCVNMICFLALKPRP